MRTLKRAEGETTSFVVLGLDPALGDAARTMGFRPTAGGFVRSFPSGSAHLDRAFENFERFIEEALLQAAGMRMTPWDQALEELLGRVDGRSFSWWLAGSAALAVRGLEVSPRDLDLIVDDAGAQVLGDLLLDGLIEPVTPAVDWICRWWGRAFVHARIEWAGGVDERADQPIVGDVGPSAQARLESIRWRGHQIRVPPLELQLAVSERRGLTERSRLIRAVLGAPS